LTTVATATAVSRQGSFFRTAANNLQQAQVAAEFAYQQLGLRTAVTIHDGTDYSRSLQQQFSQSFQRLGGNVIFQSVTPVGELEIEDLLAELLVDEPDLFYLPIFAPEANLIANKLLELDALDSVVLLGADSLLFSEFPLSAGTAVSGMYLSGTAVSNAQHNQLLRRWNTTFGTNPTGSYHAHTYDATNILLDAIEAVAIQSNGAMQIGRQALRDAIAATSE
ncbi:MAG: ABC transporter substrate-binding protein, partial [Chloroflexi bacterium]|nr:ABC transporter substrate-binding protein [Chloroflexota bacterium]